MTPCRSLAAAILVLVASACAGAAPEGPTITPEALAARLADGTAPVVLDVRSEAEYEAGHIPGAISIPHDQVATRQDELPGKDAEIVVHCQSGRRAGMAEETLREAGFTHLVDLEGHWAAWQAGDFPIEKGAPGGGS